MRVIVGQRDTAKNLLDKDIRFYSFFATNEEGEFLRK